MLWPQRSPREVPVSIGMAIARDINALSPTHPPYGLTLTDILGQYPGSLYIPPDVFWSYLRAALVDRFTTGSGIFVILNGQDRRFGFCRNWPPKFLQYRAHMLVLN